jgi:hypothetical protein
VSVMGRRRRVAQIGGLPANSFFIHLTASQNEIYIAGPDGCYVSRNHRDFQLLPTIATSPWVMRAASRDRVLIAEQASLELVHGGLSCQIFVPPVTSDLLITQREEVVFASGSNLMKVDLNGTNALGARVLETVWDPPLALPGTISAVAADRSSVYAGVRNVLHVVSSASQRVRQSIPLDSAIEHLSVENKVVYAVTTKSLYALGKAPTA